MNTDPIRNVGNDGLSATVDNIESAAENMENVFVRGKEQLEAMTESAMEASKEACEATDKFVRTRPWEAVGIAAAVGLVAGLLLRRR